MIGVGFYLQAGVIMAGAAAMIHILLRRTSLRGPARTRTTLLLLLICVAATLGWTRSSRQRISSRLELARALPEPGLRNEGFVSSSNCLPCHPAQYSSWHDSYHRSMTQEAAPTAVIGDFHGQRLEAYGRSFVVERSDDEFWVEMTDPDWERDQIDRGIDPARDAGRPPRVRKRIVMTTGSHHMQTYWVASGRDGRLFNVPFVWLTADQRWAPREDVFLSASSLAPQYATWHNNCYECHSVAGEQGIDPRSAAYQPYAAELGIACEACHGPGGPHIRANQNPLRRYSLHLAKRPDPTIVNPARLSATAATQVCAQCHCMNVFNSDPRRPGPRYRAGGDLRATRVPLRTSDRNMFAEEKSGWPSLQRHISRQNATFLQERFWKDGMARVSGRESNGLIESACFRKQTLSCISCHSMHQSRPDDQLAAGKDGDDACFQCHATYRSRVTEHTFHKAGSQGSLCYNCHMPHTTYGLLKAIRSHLIDSPTVRATLQTGRPNACNLCHLDKSLQWTADHLTRWYRQPQVELSADQRDVAASVLDLLRGDAGQRALVAWHMGWEPARETSGSDWMAPHLAHLLNDPYSAVRYIAQRSLRTLPGFESLDYDFVGPETARAAAAAEALRNWSPPDSFRPAVLLGANGVQERESWSRLADERDDTVMDLRE